MGLKVQKSRDYSRITNTRISIVSIDIHSKPSSSEVQQQIVAELEEEQKAIEAARKLIENTKQN